MVEFRIRGRRPVRSHLRYRKIAVILDVKSQLLEQARDPRRPQRRWPHQGAGLRGADLDGDTEQGDAGSVCFGHARKFPGNRRVGKALACPPFTTTVGWWARRK